ncbi:MAG: DHHA1 domain-containing protein [Chloroflexota bacterium]|nr:DHHA1 domain-containing protein [Chloroflexota bacterium]
MRAYYDDSYTHEFTAQIIERTTLDGHPAVVLDRTWFYPTGGGQPHDLGRIGGVKVVDVQTRKEDQAVLHGLEGEVNGDSAACVVEWARRFDHMQQHTGQHILSQAFVRIAGANTVGFHLGVDSVTIDLDRFDLDEARIFSAEDLANEVVFADRPVIARVIAADDPELDGVRMRGVPEARATDGLRVIDIDGFDRTACGGTHVARTGEIGLIKIIRSEKKGDKLRIEFRCGGRAIRDYRDRVRVTTALSAELTCALPDLPGAVVRLRDDLKTTARALKDAQTLILTYERDALLQNAEVRDGCTIVLADFPDRDGAALRALALLLCERASVVALLGAAGERSSYLLASSGDLPFDMNAIFKKLASANSALRGGGQANLVQGAGAASDQAGVRALLERARDLIFTTN